MTFVIRHVRGPRGSGMSLSLMTEYINRPLNVHSVKREKQLMVDFGVKKGGRKIYPLLKLEKPEK